MIASIEWRDGRVRYLDQTKLPRSESYVVTSDYRDIIRALQSLAIRGAPLIGIAGAYALALAANESDGKDPGRYAGDLTAAAKAIATARPTAVNLRWAVDRLMKLFTPHSSPEAIRTAFLAEAVRIHQEDRLMCRKIGEHGATLVPDNAVILTHCNTGALATGGEGTAQSVITTAYRLGKVSEVYADETRPLFQGSRLTAWELQKEGIPVTLITDSTAATLLRRRKIDLVIVGADRIAANGDAANKIGTYSLAIAAAHHRVPFYVAAPYSTIDPHVASGDDMIIEERSGEEVTSPAGVKTAPDGVPAWAPAFDVAPAGLITSIVTDAGIIRPPYRFGSMPGGEGR